MLFTVSCRRICRDRRRSGTKLVSVYHANAERGLPSHLATIVLHDPETGALQAILDGRYITEARTAAVSAASAKHLARNDARVLAVLGQESRPAATSTR